MTVIGHTRQKNFEKYFNVSFIFAIFQPLNEHLKKKEKENDDDKKRYQRKWSEKWFEFSQINHFFLAISIYVSSSRFLYADWDSFYYTQKLLGLKN